MWWKGGRQAGRGDAAEASATCHAQPNSAFAFPRKCLGLTKGRVAGRASAHLLHGQKAPQHVGELPRTRFLESSVVRRSSKCPGFRVGQDSIPYADNQATPSRLDFVQPLSKSVTSVCSLTAALCSSNAFVSAVEVPVPEERVKKHTRDLQPLPLWQVYPLGSCISLTSCSRPSRQLSQKRHSRPTCLQWYLAR